VSVYRARLTGELLEFAIPNSQPLTVNADQTIHQGIEAGLEANLATAWTLRANYLFNDFHFDGDRSYGNNRMAGAPRQLLAAELLYRTGNGLYFGPNLRVASAAYVDHMNTLQAAGYGVFGFKLGQRVSKNLSWFVDARNLGNKVYAATTGVVSAMNAGNQQQFYPGDGRAIYVGIELGY